ncbi:Antibiotic biosynthesis monooxygenase [Stackebrandtia soli]
MFIQVVHGMTSDAEQLKRAFDRWDEQLAPNAIGWLGTTAGVNADNQFIALARFGSASDAQANSDRPEQHDWWMQTSRLFDGDVTFHNCTHTSDFMGGGSDDAGFVQVIHGAVNDVPRMEALQDRMEETVGDFRPDIIGGRTAIHSDEAHFTEAMYFKSEAEARQGEQKKPPEELKALFNEETAMTSDLGYVDLANPWLSSPASARSG